MLLQRAELGQCPPAYLEAGHITHIRTVQEMQTHTDHRCMLHTLEGKLYTRGTFHSIIRILQSSNK